MAAVFPALAACQDNATGPREIPDHPLVRQTLHDCLHEAMDVDGLERLLDEIAEGEVRLHFRDTTEPSPLAHEILNSRPYTFLDDAPLEERRTRAVQLRRGLPVEARELATLDPEAIARVRGEAAPEPRDADELHDVLVVRWCVSRPRRGVARLVRRRCGARAARSTSRSRAASSGAPSRTGARRGAVSPAHASSRCGAAARARARAGARARSPLRRRGRARSPRDARADHARTSSRAATALDGERGAARAGAARGRGVRPARALRSRAMPSEQVLRAAAARPHPLATRRSACAARSSR